MSLKKLLCVMIASLVMSTAVYAVEISVGASFGAGLPIFRGTNYTDLIDGLEAGGYKKQTPFTIAPQLDVMFAFLPYLALETGLGYRYSTEAYELSAEAFGVRAVTTTSFTRNELYIPLMLRGQFEYEVGIGMVTYASAGVKLGFGLGDYSVVRSEVTGGLVEVDERAVAAKSAPFVLDVAFALGQEFRLGTSHYVGVRLGYDLNVLRPYATSENGRETETLPNDFDAFQDDFTVALTYRYAFGK